MLENLVVTAPYRFDSDIDEIRSNLPLKRIDFGYETMSFSVCYRAT